ncbi:lipoprotein-releasing system transmembrane subunit LolC, partial [Francisella tularensis subsp. holarctica]|nr:lipoprotein-releasing system transmembrane subunit LolC [Francisella tularensis subsp. holarctica]
KRKILMMVPPLKVYQLGGEVTDWPNLAKEVEKSTPSVTAVAPIEESQGLLSANSGSRTTAYVKIQGIEPKYQTKVLPIAE